MQNEKRNILLLSMLYFFVDIIMVWLQFVMLPNEIVMSLSNNQIASTMSEEQGINLMTFFFLKQFIYIFISAWCLVSIHQISLRQFNTIWQSFSSTLKRILGAILLSFLIFIPILIGLTEAMIAIQQNVQPSILSLFAMVIGIGLYIRFCLAPVHYLLTNDSISHSAKITWRAAMGRVSVLFIFCLLIYVLIPFVENFLTAFSGNAIMALISGILVALINVFALVVTYRFYTLFISKA